MTYNIASSKNITHLRELQNVRCVMDGGAIAFYDEDDKWQKVHTLCTFGDSSDFHMNIGKTLESLKGYDETPSICGSCIIRPPRICLGCKNALINGRDYYCIPCGSCPVCLSFNNDPEKCQECQEKSTINQ